MAPRFPSIDEEAGFEAAASTKPTSKPSDPNGTRLSTASQAYDQGNKGYLDKSEARLRKYDTNNDGKFSLPELKNIILDLQSKEKKETRWRKYTRCAGLFLLLSVVCNFVMIWTG